MAALGPTHWLIVAVIALVLLAGYWQARRQPDRRFFEGMNRTTSFALAGAMLLALALLVDVYGPRWSLGSGGEDVSLGLAGVGGCLVLLSLFFDRRSRDDRR